jgi:amino acid transporter
MAPVNDPAPAGHARLGPGDAVSIIVGIVVGAGIFETPPLVLKNVPSSAAALVLWAVAGLLTLVGALCYAELASTYPRSGGDYVYLTRAYGPAVGFLFGWAQLAVILTGSLGMMAYVFADYAVQLWDFGPGAPFAYAFTAVAALSLLNVLGLVLGKWAQNLLSAAKVLGLGGILAAGFLWPAPMAAPPPAGSLDRDALAFAMVLVLLTYGGWNDAVYVAAEVRDPRRNLPRALFLGTLLVTALYLLVNAAYLRGLGFEQARASTAVAADVFRRPLGSWGAKAVSLLVMVSALGTVNGMILTGSRLYATLGADYRLFAWLGRWHRRLRSPIAALLTQAGISLAMIAGVGTAAGRSALDAVLALARLPAASWEGHGGFETLLRCSAPVFWLFFLLTAVSLFVLRRKDRALPRPFAVPLYPVAPLLFCGTCATMLYAGIRYAGTLGLVGAVLVLAGLPLFFLSRRRPAVAPRPPEGSDKDA